MALCPWSCSFGWCLVEGHRIRDQRRPTGQMAWEGLFTCTHSGLVLGHVRQNKSASFLVNFLHTVRCIPFHLTFYVNILFCMLVFHLILKDGTTRWLVAVNRSVRRPDTSVAQHERKIQKIITLNDEKMLTDNVVGQAVVATVRVYATRTTAGTQCCTFVNVWKNNCQLVTAHSLALFTLAYIVSNNEPTLARSGSKMQRLM